MNDVQSRIDRLYEWHYGINEPMSHEKLIDLEQRIQRSSYALINGVFRWHTAYLWLTRDDLIEVIETLREQTGHNIGAEISLTGSRMADHDDRGTLNINDLISRPLRERHADLFGADTPITEESLRDLDDLLCRLPYRVEDGRREYYLDGECHWSAYGLTRIIRDLRFLTEDTQDVQLLGEEMHTAPDAIGLDHEVSDELRYYCGWLHDGAAMTTARLHETDRHLCRCEYIIRGGVPFYQAGPMWLSERQAIALLVEIRGITGFEPLGALHLAGREKDLRNE